MRRHEREIIAWSVADAAKIIGVPYRTLRRWCVDGLVALRFHPVPQKYERLRLTLDDIAEAWCIADLRRGGVSMQTIRCTILVRLDALQEREQRRLSDFKAVFVDSADNVIGVHQGTLTEERLTDGQTRIRIDLRGLRRRVREHPGEAVPAGWVRLAMQEEAGCLV